ncbi:hypothetical protein BH23BAC1_BH23BAC1_46640 [soil metagenome]
MKIILLFLLAIVSFDDINYIAKINELKKKAREAYLQQDFSAAAVNYKRLIEEYKVDDQNVVLNLANAYFQLQDTTNARLNYQRAVVRGNREVRSQALSQLGVLAHKGQQLPQSLSFFKEALKSDPSNEEARYNYELVKKLLDQKKDQESQNDEDKEDQIKPSDYAKKLKEQADLLVMERKYGPAHDLMVKGLQQDQTVAYYNDFIGRLNDIVEIDK